MYTPESSACESVEFSGNHSFTLDLSLDPFLRQNLSDGHQCVLQQFLSRFSMIFLCDSYGEIGIGSKNLRAVLDFESSNSQILISNVSIFFTQEQYEQLIWHLHICISVQKTADGRRNKYTRFAWAGGTCPRFTWADGTFFPVVLLCQFFVLAGNRFWFYILTYAT